MPCTFTTTRYGFPGSHIQEIRISLGVTRDKAYYSVFSSFKMAEDMAGKVEFKVCEESIHLVFN